MDVGQLWYDWLDAVFGDIQFCGDGLPEHIEIDGEEQFLASFNDLSVNPPEAVRSVLRTTSH